MKTSDGRTSIPSGELLSPSTKKPQQNRPSVGARGFEPLSPSKDESASTKHNTEAGRPNPNSELLSLAKEREAMLRNELTCQARFCTGTWGHKGDHASFLEWGWTQNPSGNPTVSLSPSERSEDANPSECWCGTPNEHPGLALHKNPDLLSLEDRLLVALSKRGDMSIGYFIERAVDQHTPGSVWHINDEALVLACEQYAASLPE